jgi:hypothetical protein
LAEKCLIRSFVVIENAFIKALYRKGYGKYKYYKLINDLAYKRKIRQRYQRYLNTILTSKRIFVVMKYNLQNSINDLYREYKIFNNSVFINKKQNSIFKDLLEKTMKKNLFSVEYIQIIVNTIKNTDYMDMLNLCRVAYDISINMNILSDTVNYYIDKLPKEYQVIVNMSDTIDNYNINCDKFNRPHFKCNLKQILYYNKHIVGMKKIAKTLLELKK